MSAVEKLAALVFGSWLAILILGIGAFVIGALVFAALVGTMPHTPPPDSPH